MARNQVVPLLTVLVFGSALIARAADIKDVKADVSIKQDDKMAMAKVGSIVEIKLDNTPAGSSSTPTGIADLKVIVDNTKVIQDKHDEHDTFGMTIDGKSKASSRVKSVYLYPSSEGKSKVTIEFKKGGKAEKHEYVIEVKGKK